ncbi:hypothetical protein OWR29_45795 [Actinoplanes sp. Pm04-4]|uniref:Serine/threonine protein kinase n=1 Tax=Paractinoplanes pyxinae TaxID=2997416 RepID=A0ABT4BFN6_9ACTN|nr:hypothetical protein [Actinoplanes pyxinae]MCY1145361.1 hypothetical protein [Actinoplanes pyxinae]
MSIRDDETSGANGDRDRRRKLAVTGAAGLAVVAGVGTVLLINRDDPAPPDLGAAAPIVAESSASDSTPPPTSPAPPSPSASAGPMAKADAVPAETTPAASKTPAATTQATTDEKTRKKIEAARSKAAAAGFPVQRPLTPAPGVAVENLASYRTQSRTLASGGMMRIYSAKGDLSNQREMLWAADEGEPAGDARCTQKFRFAQNATPAVRPSMLLCWRITDSRSVVVLTTAKKGTPSIPQSVKAIDTQWNKVGQ